VYIGYVFNNILLKARFTGEHIIIVQDSRFLSAALMVRFLACTTIYPILGSFSVGFITITPPAQSAVVHLFCFCCFSAILPFFLLTFAIFHFNRVHFFLCILLFLCIVIRLILSFNCSNMVRTG